MRKLATIERINVINPHPNADSLELAVVRGWQVCVKKGEFKAGDLCVYCEIDSVLPEREEFEFLRDKKFRIRTIKLRKELSQGICFPLSILPESSAWKDSNNADVTEELGVTLYQPPIPSCLGGDVVGPFPALIPKTDSERIQNHSWILNDYANLEWVATEKLDGSSCTVWWRDGELHVASRNWEMKDDERNAYWQAARWDDLHDKLRDMGIALQGELLGPKIQGNRYRLERPRLYFFDAYDFENARYLDYMEFKILCAQLELEVAPMVAYLFKLTDAFKLGNMPAILDFAEGDSQLQAGVEREGLVFKPMKEHRDYRMGRLAFKAISNRFLLKGGD